MDMDKANSDSLHHDSNWLYGIYVEEEFYSRFHVAIILDDKLIRNEDEETV